MRKSIDATLGFVLNEEKRISSRRKIPSLVLTDLDFADDIALLSSTFANTQKLLDNLLLEAKFVDLSLNIDKTKYILGGQWENHEKEDLFVEGKKLELVDDFKYLGTFLKVLVMIFNIAKSWAGLPA